MGSRVLAVVAHPDDELLGLGGTLLRHVEEGDEVSVLIECCDRLRDGPIRREAAERVASEAGWSIAFGLSRELGYRVPELKIDADVVYTHHPGDLNRDHRLVCEAVQVASRPHTADVKSLRYFETPSSTEWGTGFVPNLFIDTERWVGLKGTLLGEYDTELRPWPHPRSDVGIRDRSRYWGSVAGYRAAEPFVIGRERW